MFIFSILTFVISIVRSVIVALGLLSTVVGLFWSAVYGSVAFAGLRYLFKVDHNPSIETAFLIGATAFFERTHIERSAEKLEEHFHKMLDHHINKK